MSALFHLNIQGHPFSVEVSRDGSISFHGYSYEQMEYDKSMVEFGEIPTPELTILYEWEINPFTVIFKEFDIDFKTLLLIVSDYVSHAFSYSKMSSSEHEKTITKAINTSREFALTGTNYDFYLTVHGVAEVLKLKNQLYDIPELSPWESEIVDSVQNVIRAVMVYSGQVYSDPATKHIPHTRLWDARSHAVNAAAYGLPKVATAEDLGWTGYYDIEVEWQIARFVDVMEALQSRKPYPPLGVTK